MKLRDIYLKNNPRNIILRGLLGLLAVILCATAYTVFTGRNILFSFALPIFGVPIMLTILNLRMCPTKRE